MRENIDILGVFHDGTVVEVRGVLPELTLRIEIEYLRRMFSLEGNSFLVKVKGCESIEYWDWDADTRTCDLSEIESAEPEVLYVEQRGETAYLSCVNGELEIVYKELQVQLDTGASVSFEDLGAACDRYWNDPLSRK